MNLSRHIHYLLFGLICLSPAPLKLVEQQFERAHTNLFLYYREYPNYLGMVALGIVLFLTATIICRCRGNKVPWIYLVVIIGSLINYIILGAWENVTGYWGIQVL